MLPSWGTIHRNAVARLGQAEFDRRVSIAEERARWIAADRSWFREERDREGVRVFVAHRLRALAIQLGAAAFAKFEAMDHNALAATVVRLLEKGVLI
jgi:hypothetical protein